MATQPLRPSLPHWSRRIGLRMVLAALLGFAGFALLSYATIDLAPGSGRIAAVWLPNAIAVAILLRGGLTGQASKEKGRPRMGAALFFSVRDLA